MAKFEVIEYIRDEGRIILSYPDFDFDAFESIATQLITQLSALVVEKQLDADLKSWLCRFEGIHFLLRAEFYSQSLWIESMSVELSQQTLDRIVHQITSA